MEITIRKISGIDLELAKSGISLFLNAGEVITNDEKLLSMLSREDFHYLVALSNGNVIGRLISYEFELFKENTREAYLYEIDVLEDYQRQGVATTLVEHMKSLCRLRGISAMFVGTEPDNIPAQALYKKTGGVLEGNLPHFVYHISSKENE